MNERGIVSGENPQASCNNVGLAERPIAGDCKSLSKDAVVRIHHPTPYNARVAKLYAFGHPHGFTELSMQVEPLSRAPYYITATA